jgi:ankyrin repeat protein
VHSQDISEASRRLNEAVVLQDIQGVTSAIEAGADVNNEFLTLHPLHRAASHCNPAIIRILIDHGANIEQGNGPPGRTALHEAALKGNLKCVEALIEKGADVNAQNNNGRTALFYAESPTPPLKAPSNSAEIVRYLRSKGAKK